MSRLPPLGYGRTVLERRARERRREEQRARELEAAASDLGFTGLRLAPGARLSRAELEGLADNVRAEAARRKQPRRLTPTEDAVLFPRRRERG
jgi:hypothetical protein